MTESLSQKANKQSVANALHRKANRSDIEDMLANKVEVHEFQHLQSQLQNRAEHQQIDELMRLVDRKPDITELESLRQDLTHKVGRHDFDML